MSKHRKGFKTKWGRGDCWDSSAVMDTLRNECYTGIWIHGKKRTITVGSRQTKKMPRSEWIIIPDAIPALITKEQFMAVQEKLDANARSGIKRGKSNTPRSVFSSLIKCAYCDRVMDFWTRAYGHGSFGCKTLNRTDKFGCSPDKIKESDLYDAVLTILQQQIALVDLHQTIVKATSPIVPKTTLADIQSLQKFVEQAKSTKISLWENYHNGSITKEKFQAESERFTAQVSEYESKISELSVMLENDEIQGFGEVNLTKRMAELTGIQSLTRELVLEFIDGIKVYSSDRIEIVWKYGDAFERMAKSIESSF